MPELFGARVLAKLVYPWFERACFCLVALLMQCEFPLYYTHALQLWLCSGSES